MPPRSHDGKRRLRVVNAHGYLLEHTVEPDTPERLAQLVATLAPHVSQATWTVIPPDPTPPTL